MEAEGDAQPEQTGVQHVHLYERSGTFHVYYLLDGKRIRKSLKTGNKKHAEAIRTELEYKLLRRELREEHPARREELLPRYIAEQEVRKTKKSAATDRCYLERFFEAVPIPDLRTLSSTSIADYLTRRARAEKLAPKTLNRIRQVLGTFYRWLLDHPLCQHE